MLLGTTANKKTFPGAESLIIQLMLQQRYAEAYELLLDQLPTQPSVLYNLALCLHWSGNYQEALKHLERIQLVTQPIKGSQLNSEDNYKQLKNKQNVTDDHLKGISEDYVSTFPILTHDAITRLKTDCWLQLCNYGKVIAVATPIAHKGYKNINEALKTAHSANDNSI